MKTLKTNWKKIAVLGALTLAPTFAVATQAQAAPYKAPVSTWNNNRNDDRWNDNRPGNNRGNDNRYDNRNNGRIDYGHDNRYDDHRYDNRRDDHRYDYRRDDDNKNNTAKIIGAGVVGAILGAVLSR